MRPQSSVPNHESLFLTAAISMLGLAAVLSQVTNVQAAELKALAGGGIAGPMRELGPAFERASGHKIAFQFGATPELIKAATSGAPFDLAVVPQEVFQDAGARAAVVSGPTTEIARVGFGIAVRAGAPKPDISTPEAMKQTLLKAQSIATLPASAAGAQVLRTFERLGIGDALKPKIKAVTAPAAIVEAVAKGEAELGVFLTNVLTAPGVDLVGPVPARVAAEPGLHGGRRRENEQHRRRAGVPRFSDDTRSGRGDQGQGHGAVRSLASTAS